MFGLRRRTWKTQQTKKHKQLKLTSNESSWCTPFFIEALGNGLRIVRRRTDDSVWFLQYTRSQPHLIEVCWKMESNTSALF